MINTNVITERGDQIDVSYFGNDVFCLHINHNMNAVSDSNNLVVKKYTFHVRISGTEMDEIKQLMEEIKSKYEQ